MAMLWFFSQFWEKDFIVAHLEHGIRGSASLRDSDFVQCACLEMGIRFEKKHISVPRSRKKGESLEQAARRLRYLFLREVINNYGGSFVALAHTADDVAETVIHNLTRGSGPYGLIGIPERRDVFIRPLIDFYREELREILRSRSISWSDDETNLDVNILRNRIRLELLPWLSNYVNERSKEHIVSTAKTMVRAREQERMSGSSTLLWAKRYVPFSLFAMDIKLLRKIEYSLLPIVLRSLGRKFGLTALNRKRTEELVNLILKSGRWSFQWQENYEICAGQGYVALLKKDILKKTDFTSFTSRVLDQYKCFSLKGWRIAIYPDTDNITDRSGTSQASVPLLPGENLDIKPLSECRSEISLEFIKAIPWWLYSCWPVFIYGNKIIWSPVFGSIPFKIESKADRVQYNFRIIAEERC